jgi:NAD(P)-dependent dehydrogenase (short-subunit alcohol dehydrogenase family)
MLLENKNAVVYGAGGAIGGAVARAFAREGARVFLTGRTMDKIDAVAGDISAAGGVVETAEVDVLDERAVEEHADAVAQRAGRIDVSFNAIGIPQQGVQGIPLVDLSPESFGLPIRTYTTAQFLTARAAARRMVEHGSGVILTLTATPARLAAPLVGAWERHGRRSKPSPGACRRNSDRGASVPSACGRTGSRRRRRFGKSTVFTPTAPA